jgi:hypothetical protein
MSVQSSAYGLVSSIKKCLVGMGTLGGGGSVEGICGGGYELEGRFGGVEV